MLDYLADTTLLAGTAAALLALCASVFIWRGWAIRYGGHHDIIKDFDERRLKNPDAWARHAGLIDIFLGLACLGAAVAALLLPTRSREIAVLAIVVLFVAWGPLIGVLQKHEEP